MKTVSKRILVEKEKLDEGRKRIIISDQGEITCEKECIQTK